MATKTKDPAPAKGKTEKPAAAVHSSRRAE